MAADGLALVPWKVKLAADELAVAGAGAVAGLVGLVGLVGLADIGLEGHPGLAGSKMLLKLRGLVQRIPVCYRIVGQHSVSFGTSLSQLKDNIGTVLEQLLETINKDSFGTTLEYIWDNFLST